MNLKINIESKKSLKECKEDTCKNGGVCKIEKETAVCFCINDWAGQYCNKTKENVQEEIKKITNVIGNLDSSKTISNDVIQSFIDLQSLIISDSSIVTPEMNNKVLNILQNQIDSIQKGNIGAYPELLNLMDLSFQMNL